MTTKSIALIAGMALFVGGAGLTIFAVMRARGIAKNRRKYDSHARRK